MILGQKTGAANVGQKMCQQFYIDPAALQCYSTERQRRTCKLRRINLLIFPYIEIIYCDAYEMEEKQFSVFRQQEEVIENRTKLATKDLKYS